MAPLEGRILTINTVSQNGLNKLFLYDLTTKGRKAHKAKKLIRPKNLLGEPSFMPYFLFKTIIGLFDSEKGYTFSPYFWKAETKFGLLSFLVLAFRTEPSSILKVTKSATP